MVTTILVILFSLYACVESFIYAIYEIKINENKFGGGVLVFLSLAALILPNVSYFLF